MIEQILQADRYLKVDQVAKARGMYAQVVELDPRNAIAMVGLARCALAEGDEREAHRLAGRALEMDPENDMARRMEARLAEIFAERGERVARPAEEILTTAGTAGPQPPASPPSPSASPASPSASPAPPPPGPAPRPSFLQRLLGR